MNAKIKIGLAALLAFGSVVACGSSPASSNGTQTKAGAITRLITQSLPDIEGKEGMVEIVDFAPGEASQVHRHNCDLFVYVLSGTVETQLKGGRLQTVHTGGTFSESPTDIHVVSRNASGSEPAKLAVFYVKAKGTPPTEILPDGAK
ncbi:cupin domain-containing protein [Kutzneria sp. 744]|uniref:cupin domain-containing protein n=1 Tax=Kutzneria sp. (strain 744) TaxID=345341 RepID=UPI0004B5A39A|nr:cupin domain-containing protein [Kutzneria sp. 744]